MGPKVQLLSLLGKHMGTGGRHLFGGAGDKISPLRSVANKEGLQVCLVLVFFEWIKFCPRARGLRDRTRTTWPEGLCLHIAPKETSSE